MLLKAKVSLKRLNKFLNADELDEASVSHDPSGKPQWQFPRLFCLYESCYVCFGFVLEEKSNSMTLTFWFEYSDMTNPVDWFDIDWY